MSYIKDRIKRNLANDNLYRQAYEDEGRAIYLSDSGVIHLPALKLGVQEHLRWNRQTETTGATLDDGQAS